MSTDAKPTMTVGSLFSGIGGLELGLERAGMQVVWQVENDPYATRVLEKHWPDVRRWDDVTTFPPDTDSSIDDRCEVARIQERQGTEFGGTYGEWRVDLICGGFPCQPVSTAGRRAGKSDARWLWPEMLRVIRTLKPRWVVAENVPGLLSIDSGRVFGGILADLAESGFDVEWQCVPAAAVGAPHIRDRVFIIGAQCTDADGGRHVFGKTGVVPAKANDNAQRELNKLCPTMANALCPRLEVESCEPRDNGKERKTAQRDCDERQWWAVEPDVGRVAHGVSKRVDRLRCLGNAVVPQVAEFIGRQIILVEPT